VAAGGFTLLEVMVALAVLVVGLMGAALLMSTTYKYSVRSRFMAEAAQLASEKLEDLARFPANDQHVTVMSGDTTCGYTYAGVNCEGSLTSDSGPQSITVSGTTFSVFYYDTVFLAASNTTGSYGTLQETYQTAGKPNPSYSTLTFYPNGATPTVATATTAPTTGETFDRRWVIEQDQPVAGVRRVTVLVTLVDATIQPAVTFQMSMVRQ
jgi:prepilin-type N-terminal cleavage/methylation domain-containing protein